MSLPARALKISAQAAAALGIISITLSGEITPAWLVLSWTAWTFSLVADRYPDFQAGLRRLEIVAVAAMVGMIFIDFFVFHNSISLAVTHFLLLFQTFKLAGEKARKDCLQIFLFSFFQILAACTLSVDPWHAAVLLLLIPTAAAALFWNQMAKEIGTGPLDAITYRCYRRMAALICIGALPLNLILTIGVFVLFPRLTLNARLPGFSGQRMGYIDQVNLSQKGTLQESARVVIWLSFPRSDERKNWDGHLRGDTLSVFNGHDWKTLNGKRMRILTPDSNGIFVTEAPRSHRRAFHESITLADTSGSTLFTIGRPLRIVTSLPALQEYEGGSLHWLSALRRPLHYEATSEPGSIDEVRPVHLELPNVPLERVRALVNKVAGGGSPLKQARNVEQFLQKNYRYTTNFGNQIADNPVDYFLFDRKQGACGHFASAMAVMLRLRHIPSRLVAGYLKGEWNEPAQAVVVRERDAHAWVEAYIQGAWVTFDPSPRQAYAASYGASAYNRWRQYNDYFGLQWNQFVIQYDLYAQIKAFETVKGGSGRLGSSLASWWGKIQFRFHHSRRLDNKFSDSAGRPERPFPWKETGFSCFFVLLGFILMARRRFVTYDSTIRFYSRFLERMARIGFPKQAWETGFEFAARVSRLKPDEAADAWRITKQYYESRFGKGIRMTKIQWCAIAGIALCLTMPCLAADPTSSVSSLIHDLQSDEPDQREHAAEELGNRGRAAEGAIDALKKALNDDFPYVRTHAAESLSKIGPASIPAFIEALKNPNGDVRAISASALGQYKFRANAAVPDLINALHDPETPVRQRAAQSLEQIGSAVVTPLLHFIATNHGEPVILAMKALGGVQTTDPQLIPGLITVLGSTDDQLRLGAVKALARQGAGHSAELVQGLQSASPPVRALLCDVLADVGRHAAIAVPSLIELLKDPDPSVRGSAARALGHMGSVAAKTAVSPLKKLVTDDPDTTVVMRAREALTNITAATGGNLEPQPEPAALQKSKQRVPLSSPAKPKKSEKMAARTPAVLPHKKSKKAVSIPQLINLLQSPDETVRTNAVQSLIQVGVPAIPALTKTLQEGTTTSRFSAATAFVQIDSSAAIQTFQTCSKEGDLAIRLDAILNLQTMGTQASSAVPTLSDLLKDPAADIRQAAETALLSIGTTEARKAVKDYHDQEARKNITSLIKTLRQGGKEADAAGPALVKIGAPAVQPVSVLLSDTHPETRRVAAHVLNQMGSVSSPATNALINALDDSDAGVRRESAEALGKIGSPDAQKALRFFPTKEKVRGWLSYFKRS